MAESGDPITPAAAPSSRDALSRALGAAFLSHQVEQLEKSVGNATYNWRNRDRGGRNGNAGKERGAPPVPGSPSKTRLTPAASGRKRGGTDTSGDGRYKERRGSSGELAVGDIASEKNEREMKPKEKDADIVVVDASVLVHALYQVKKWCREGREEVVIVPLEALNSLDLLKKGTSPLAQRARAASRILEAQVGTNKRIKVQMDDAFVLWDDIALGPGEKDETSPEWVRRTICCAKWEVDNAKPVLATAAPLRVALAVLHPPLPSSNNVNVPQTPAHHALRVSGGIVAHWARRAGVNLLEVAPSAAGAAKKTEDDTEEVDDRKAKRYSDGPGSGRGRTGRGGSFAQGTGSGGPWGAKAGGAKGAGKGLVERPAAVIAMMEPGRPVVRVLARGEKLDVGP